MHNQELRKVYRKAIIKHEDANHSFPFDNCYMSSCKVFWNKTHRTTTSTITDPKKQLELLAAHQEEFERFLKELTGLKVRVHLYVHSADNSEQDLHSLFEASLTLPDFEQKITSNRSWFTHKDLARHISVFMPEDFNIDNLYPESSDDEGYRQAVEYINGYPVSSHTDTQEGA